MEVNLPLKIIGHGRYLPKRIVPSSELEAMCGVPAGWVERRNGVRERRWVTDETSSFMSASAAAPSSGDTKLRVLAIVSFLLGIIVMTIAVVLVVSG